MGTEKAQEHLPCHRAAILPSNGVELLFGCEVHSISGLRRRRPVSAASSPTARTSATIEAGRTIVATGRRGADWLETLCAEHDIAHQPGTVDIGVRVEVRNEVMETGQRGALRVQAHRLSRVRSRTRSARSARTPAALFQPGELRQRSRRRERPLLSRKLKSAEHEPLHSLLAQFHRAVQPAHQPTRRRSVSSRTCSPTATSSCSASATFSTASAPGKRSSRSRTSVRRCPTPSRAISPPPCPTAAMMNIINFIQAVDQVVPGFASYETLLYSPELKFYTNRVKMDADLNTEHPPGCTASATRQRLDARADDGLRHGRAHGPRDHPAGKHLMKYPALLQNAAEPDG